MDQPNNFDQQPDVICTEDKKEKVGRDYFSMEKAAWHRACNIEDPERPGVMNIGPALAYALICQGVDQKKGTSEWSCKAVCDHIGLSRANAKSAVRDLVAHGLIDDARYGTSPPPPRGRPFYNILPISNGTSEASNRLWLPNTLVTGAAKETPPLQFFSEADELDALRLLISLYHLHDLPTFGGLPGAMLSKRYAGQCVHQYAQYNVIRFTPVVDYLPEAQHYQSLGYDLSNCTDTNEFARDLNTSALFYLIENKFIEFVPHIFNGIQDTANLLFSFNPRYESDPLAAENKPEERMAALMSELLEGIMQYQPPPRAGEIDVLMPQHMSKPDLRMVARMRYRPQTYDTAAWWAQTHKKCNRLSSMYEKTLHKLRGYPL